jgi:hypothetical protein
LLLALPPAAVVKGKAKAEEIGKNYVATSHYLNFIFAFNNLVTSTIAIQGYAT